MRITPEAGGDFSLMSPQAHFSQSARVHHREIQFFCHRRESYESCDFARFASLLGDSDTLFLFFNITCIIHISGYYFRLLNVEEEAK